MVWRLIIQDDTTPEALYDFLVENANKLDTTTPIKVIAKGEDTVDIETDERASEIIKRIYTLGMIEVDV